VEPLTRSGTEKSVVRIVVLQPAEAASGRAPGVIAALERLGAEAVIDVVADAEACTARCRAADVDLIVVDLARGAERDRVLDAHRRGGPPVVVADAEGGDEAALDAFRRGAADCVSAKAGYTEILPVVALEQIRRWRAIQEQGAAERRIRELERANENILHNMNSAVLVVDAEARITSCNPPAEEILGRRAQDLQGLCVWDWFRAAGSDQGLVARTLGEEVRFKGAESVITRADGTVVPIGISCAPIFAADGTKRGAVAIFQDLSEIMQLRNQVLQTEKMASIGQLAAGVAHEINNPMGFIHANLFQMAEYLTRGDPEDVRRAADGLAALADETDVPFLLTDLATAIRESQEGSERIRHIVQDLRDFSHHETGERVLANVNQCLDSTANIVWPMMKHLAVLEKDYGDVPSIYCFPMQLKQGERVPGPRGERGPERRDGAHPVALDGAQRRRPHLGVGQRGRHRPGEPRPHLRSLLHHQEGGLGHGAGPFHLLQHRAAPRRDAERGERRRGGHDVPRVPAP
jgi:PAS domain S-box-containing protein